MSKATQTDAMGSIQRGIKRTLDFVMSALGLILLSPIFIIISVLMKFQGNGSVGLQWENYTVLNMERK